MREGNFTCKNNRLISRVPEGIKGIGLLDKNLKGVRLINAPKFIVDNNVGKLVKWLRVMGYDTCSLTSVMTLV